MRQLLFVIFIVTQPSFAATYEVAPRDFGRAYGPVFSDALSCEICPVDGEEGAEPHSIRNRSQLIVGITGNLTPAPERVFSHFIGEFEVSAIPDALFYNLRVQLGGATNTTPLPDSVLVRASEGNGFVGYDDRGDGEILGLMAVAFRSVVFLDITEAVLNAKANQWIYFAINFAFPPDTPSGLSGITIPRATPPTIMASDISAIPVPPAIWLFGSGLLGLLLRSKA